MNGYRASLKIAFGNEEETMLMIGPDGAPYNEYHEAVEFVENLERYLPSNIKSVDSNGRYFLQNGSLVYDGGTGSLYDDETDMSRGANLERATPECTNPTEITAAVQANEQLLTTMIGSYISRLALNDIPYKARIQRRVIDSDDHTRGCHDSFDLINPENLRRFRGDNLAVQLILAHLATRSLVTGAGLVNDSGFYFGQKVTTLTHTEQYGYVNSAYRFTEEIDTGSRLEIRCNDINISPWALKMRTATTAMIVALGHTPAIRNINKLQNPPLLDHTDFITKAQEFNKATISEEGVLQSAKNSHFAIDTQEKIYSLLARELPKFIELPDEYHDILNEGRRYCQDFRKVLNGDSDISTLSDRSDVAAKFMHIGRQLRRDIDLGKQRSPNDVISQMWDLKYDLIEISMGAYKPRIEYGYGYKLRDKGHFRSTPSDTAVDRALYRPPDTTRAYVRGTLIQKGLVEHCSWANLKLNYPVVESLPGEDAFHLQNTVLPHKLNGLKDVVDYISDKAED